MVVHDLVVKNRASVAKLLGLDVPGQEARAAALEGVAKEVALVGITSIDAMLSNGALHSSVLTALRMAKERFPDLDGDALLTQAVAALLRDNVVRASTFLGQKSNECRKEALRLEGEARAKSAAADELEHSMVSEGFVASLDRSSTCGIDAEYLA